MRGNISNVLCVIGAPLFGSTTLAPRRSTAFRNSAGTWSRAPGKQFGVLDRWRNRHTRPARWSDMLRIRPVRWRKWNRIRIDLARLADPIVTTKRISAALAEAEIYFLVTLRDTIYMKGGILWHWTLTAALTHVVFRAFKSTFTDFVHISINCHVLPLADPQSKFTLEVWQVTLDFGSLNRGDWAHFFYFSQIQRK